MNFLRKTSWKKMYSFGKKMQSTSSEFKGNKENTMEKNMWRGCLLYTSDAADE